MTRLESTSRKRIRFQEYMAFFITKRCPLRCSHCFMGASSDRHEEMDLDAALDWMRQAASMGTITTVSISGGEPFLVYEKTQRLVRSAVEWGMETAVVTSAYWAVTSQTARRLIGGLQGLTYLGISVDRFHQAFVPLTYIENAIAAASELGVPHIRIALAYVNKQEAENYKVDFRRFPQVKVTSAPITLVGRADKELRDCLDLPFESAWADHACTGLNIFTNQPDGTVFACCGPVVGTEGQHPLKLGNLFNETLQAVLERAQQDPLVQALRLWGPFALARMAQGAGLAHLLRPIHVADNICDLCCDVLSQPVIVEELRKRLNSPSWQRKIALERLFFLGEPQALIEPAAVNGANCTVGYEPLPLALRPLSG